MEQVQTSAAAACRCSFGGLFFRGQSEPPTREKKDQGNQNHSWFFNQKSERLEYLIVFHGSLGNGWLDRVFLMNGGRTFQGSVCFSE